MESESGWEGEAVGQINSWVFFLHCNDEIWCKQIWCIIIALLHCFPCVRVGVLLVSVLLWLCVCYMYPPSTSALTLYLHKLPESQKNIYLVKINPIATCTRSQKGEETEKKFNFSIKWLKFRTKPCVLKWLRCVHMPAFRIRFFGSIITLWPTLLWVKLSCFPSKDFWVYFGALWEGFS